MRPHLSDDTCQDARKHPNLVDEQKGKSAKNSNSHQKVLSSIKRKNATNRKLIVRPGNSHNCPTCCRNKSRLKYLYEPLARTLLENDPIHEEGHPCQHRSWSSLFPKASRMRSSPNGYSRSRATKNILTVSLLLILRKGITLVIQNSPIRFLESEALITSGKAMSLNMPQIFIHAVSEWRHIFAIYRAVEFTQFISSIGGSCNQKLSQLVSCQSVWSPPAFEVDQHQYFLHFCR